MSVTDPDYAEREALAVRLGWVCKGRREIEVWLPPGVPDEPGQYMELPSLQHLEATRYPIQPGDKMTMQHYEA